VIGHITHVFPLTTGIVALVAFKLVTNTAAALALRYDRFALELSGLNVLADLVTMTGAIHATGGVLSPILPIYGIELTVIALLTNVGITVAVGTITFALYAAMIALERSGVLPSLPPIYEVAAGGVNDTYRATTLVFVAFVIALPTAFAASILRQLRSKEDALVTSNQALVEAGRQKTQFMANITHELRTPIHGICGLADLIDAGVYGPATEKQRDAARNIKSSALSLLRLIDDLLTLARDDAGRLEYRPTDVSLDEVVATVMAGVHSLRGTRNLHVDADVEPELPTMFTDRGKLVQVLMNLVANAVKFTPDEGHVTLRVRRAESERVALAVVDDGIGIPERQKRRIFEPFRQVDGSAERAYGGAGLGLALVARLVSMMGGEIALQSEVGRGSTFTVTLPIVGPPSMRTSGEHPMP
jgi:signal transduction histidine kinase